MSTGNSNYTHRKGECAMCERIIWFRPVDYRWTEDGEEKNIIIHRRCLRKIT